VTNSRTVLIVLICILACVSNIQAQTRPQTTFPFSQIAIGQNGDGTQYVTDIILTNITGTAATGTFVYKTNSGDPFYVNVTSLASGQSANSDTFSFTLAAYSTTIYEATSSSPVAAGWALISTEASAGGNGTPISGTAAFILQDSAGNVLSSAGVGGTGFVTDFFTPTENRYPDLRTGVAIANFAQVSNVLTIRLYDSSGNLSRSTTVTLPPFGHFSAFVDEIYGISRTRNLDIGILEVSGTQYMSGVVIEYLGNSLTTFPVIATQVTALDVTLHSSLDRAVKNPAIKIP